MVGWVGSSTKETLAIARNFSSSRQRDHSVADLIWLCTRRLFDRNVTQLGTLRADGQLLPTRLICQRRCPWKSCGVRCAHSNRLVTYSIENQTNVSLGVRYAISIRVFKSSSWFANETLANGRRWGSWVKTRKSQHCATQYSIKLVTTRVH